MASQSQFKDVLIGFSAFLIWGLSPAYWKLISRIPAFEIILHRIFWSFLFLIPLILFQRSWPELKKIVTQPKQIGILFLTALLISCNWLTYIWAVNNGFILQASLGYYITPLINVLLGVIFLKERLRRPQILAFLMALSGVIFLTVSYGQFPFIALALAITFGFYGLLRKIVKANALTGLLMETFFLSIPASIWLITYHIQGTSSFLTMGLKVDFLLMGAAPITAIPLLLFALAARKLTLSAIGFIQYTGPTTMFLLGVFVYDEPFHLHQLITFIIIWGALVIFSADSYHNYKVTQ